jgi:hypothetical protein
MRSTLRCPWMLATVVAAVAFAAAPSSALTFSSSCDRFEVDGNEFGPVGGAFDFVDEFDGTLAPSWVVLLGTAVESGGTVTVRNPGASIPLGSAVLEISTIENEAHGISDGSGDFTMLSDWGLTLPATNSELHMQLYAVSPIIEAAGITVNNTSPEVAALSGAIPGYSVSQSVTQGFGSGFTTLQSNSVAIVPSSVTGHIILKMTFDDATNMLTCSFSLDDGQTFSTFPPMHIFNAGVIDYDVLLGAAGITPPSPPPPPPGPEVVPLNLFEVKNPNVPAARKLRYNAKAPGLFPPPFGNLPAFGALLTVQVDAARQCFPMPPGNTWTSRSGGSAFTYRDPTGAYGPVKVASVRRGNHGLFQTKAVILGKLGALTLVPPNPGARADVRLSLATGTEYCGSTVGGVITRNDAQSFKAKGAPAPAVCGVPVCSPGGAFLD